MNTPYYENLEFSLTNGQSDYDLADKQSGFLAYFSAVRDYPFYVEIRTNEEITVKINLTTNDSITISSTDIPYIIQNMEIRNLFLSNASGQTAAVKLRFQYE